MKLQNQTVTASTKEPLWEQIKTAIWLWKLGIFSWKLDRIHKKARRRYCNNGYHKLTSQSHSWTIDSKTTTIRYLKCVHCEYRFFASNAQRLKYIEMSEKWHNTTKEGFSALWKSLSSAKSRDCNKRRSRQPKRPSVSVAKNE